MQRTASLFAVNPGGNLAEVRGWEALLFQRLPGPLVFGPHLWRCLEHFSDTTFCLFLLLAPLATGLSFFCRIQHRPTGSLRIILGSNHGPNNPASMSVLLPLPTNGQHEAGPTSALCWEVCGGLWDPGLGPWAALAGPQEHYPSS